MFTAALFVIAEKQKQKWMNKQIMIYLHSEYYSTKKGLQKYALSSISDLPGEFFCIC